jgi:hypothetical protein
LRQAQEEAKEALFTLLLLEQEAKQEADLLQACINKASNRFSKRRLLRILRKAEKGSQDEWEEEWKHSWVDSDGEEDPAVYQKAPEPYAEEDPGSPVDVDSELPPESTEVLEPQLPDDENSAHNETPPVVQKCELRSVTQGWELPVGFVQSFGPTSLRPNPPPVPKTRRLRREYMRVMRPSDDSDPVLVDMRATMAAHRKFTRAKVAAHTPKQQALQNDLWAIVRPTRDHPMHVDWTHFHEEFGTVEEEMTAGNPFTAPGESEAIMEFSDLDYRIFQGF